MDTSREKKKRTSKKNVDGRSTSSHDNRKFKIRSMETQGGMAFGFRKTATAVIQLGGWMDGWMDGLPDRQTDRQTDGRTDGQTDSQKGGQTDSQKGGQTDRQIDRQIDR
jgi:hypothetical protein